MFKKYRFFAVVILLIISPGAFSQQKEGARFLSYIAAPSDITLYWKDDAGKILSSIQNLKLFVEGKNKELKFAMNGGMYNKDNSPQGLFIENSVICSSLDTLSGSGNFYMKPNGIFYLMQNDSAVICKTTDFKDSGQIKFATQSGPMLLVDGRVHPAFKKGSANLNIRNGVGILPDGNVIFAISTQEVNFYDFALFFKSMNCENALYLDGFVSRAYMPDSDWKQLDGNFGVMIGVTK